MKTRKIITPILAALSIAVLAGLVLSTAVQAQEGQPINRLRKLRPIPGKVTAVGSQEFTIEKRDGTNFSFEIDDQTQFRGRDRTTLALSDLKVGRWVGVVTGRFADPNIARLVVIMPADFDPSALEAIRGRITAVDEASGQITLKSPVGTKNIQTDDETVYLGQIKAFSDIEVGMIVLVTGEISEAGGIIANHVRGGFADERFAGKVTSIEQNEFTIKNRQGEEITFQVTGDTQFRAFRRGEAEYENLKVGMVVLVGAKELGNGSYQAEVVGLLRRR